MNEPIQGVVTSQAERGQTSVNQPAVNQTGEKHSERFFLNVLWSWVATGTGIFTAVILSPILIHKLGDERYGIWTLTFALLEYVFMFDLGFRSAIVNSISRSRVHQDAAAIEEILNTALVYFCSIALIVTGSSIVLAGQVLRYFHIAPAYQADFVFLIRLIGFTWAVGIISNAFQASLEASQNFKSINRIMALTMLLRASGCAVLLYLGFGLRGLGILVTCSQCLGYVLVFLTFRRTYGAFRFSRHLFKFERWKAMAAYGVHSFTAAIGLLFLNQGPPVLIGHYLSEAFVGYYSLPSKLLQYMVEMVTRIGFVTVPKTAELLAAGAYEQIVRLGIYLNRYCLALFMPLSIFIVVFGRELIQRWIGSGFALYGAAILPIFAVSMLFAVAGQFNSGQILFGMAKHRNYSRSLVIESIASVAGMVLVLPRYGIVGAAWVSCTLMLVNRGLITPWMVCSNLGYSYISYMSGIYVRPVLTLLPVLAFALWIKQFWIAGATWPQLITAAASIASLCLGLSYFTVLESQHRAVMWGAIRSRLGMAA